MPGRSSARSDPLRKNGEAMPKVEFHFDFGSPNAYLAHLVIPEIEQRTGAKFEYVPVLLGGATASPASGRTRSSPSTL